MENTTQEPEVKEEAQKPQEEITTNDQNEDTPEKINWKRFREARQKEREQKLEAEKRASEKEAEAEALRKAMEALVNKPQANQDYDEEESESARIQRMVRESLEAERKRIEAEQAQREAQEFPQRLQSQFSDFNQVCSADNLDYLEYHYPEVATAYKHMPDGYDKWASIYKAVKRFVPNTQSQKEEKKIDRNLGRPQSMSVGGRTHTSDTAPSYLDDAKREANWLRMQKVMRGG
jgi:hypothetical protein